MGSSLTGAWELVSDTHEGLLFISGSYWGEITVERDRKRFEWDKMTESDELEAFRSLEAVGGRYTLSGMSATANITVAKYPTMVGMTAIADFAVEEDSLTRRGTKETVFRRIG